MCMHEIPGYSSYFFVGYLECSGSGVTTTSTKTTAHTCTAWGWCDNKDNTGESTTHTGKATTMTHSHQRYRGDVGVGSCVCFNYDQESVPIEVTITVTDGHPDFDTLFDVTIELAGLDPSTPTSVTQSTSQPGTVAFSGYGAHKTTTVTVSIETFTTSYTCDSATETFVTAPDIH